MMKLSIQCTSFEVIIVVVQVGAVKIYVAAMEALKENERGGQNSEHDQKLNFLIFKNLLYIFIYNNFQFIM
jgi:hypothetical protein